MVRRFSGCPWPKNARYNDVVYFQYSTVCYLSLGKKNCSMLYTCPKLYLYPRTCILHKTILFPKREKSMHSVQTCLMIFIPVCVIVVKRGSTTSSGTTNTCRCQNWMRTIGTFLGTSAIRPGVLSAMIYVGASIFLSD